MKLRSFTFR